MMLVISGTLPIKGLNLTEGLAIFKGDLLTIDRLEVVPSLGTTAMASAAAITCETLGCGPPFVILIGDVGNGEGSRELYRYLSSKLPELNPRVCAMHYIMPFITGMRRVVESISKKTVLLADAGSMYAAKAGGIAERFDIFTPDAGELAFLADPDATHPAYVHRLLFEIDTSEVTELIRRAYQHHNIPEILLVKGRVDYITKEGKVVQSIEEPAIEAMEAIGGTGDSLSGILAALVYAEYDKIKACVTAAKVNRIAGRIAKPDPATPVREIIKQIPKALREVKV